MPRARRAADVPEITGQLGDLVRREVEVLLAPDAAADEEPDVEQIGHMYEGLRGRTARRRSGAHYTPRSLTEPLVCCTLEPLVYTGPGEGKPRGHRKLRPAGELLDLKICDPACGCGAFLVQACRYLAERLAEAWAEADRLDPEVPSDPALRLAHARRLIARRCLYGVDIDPLAVEMTRLSLGLLAPEPGRPPLSLEHTIRCGDSLRGIDEPDPSPGCRPFTDAAFHWPLEFPEVFRGRPGFDAVVGNPPWGQKAVAAGLSYKRHLQTSFPSCKGIFDLFRPFVERGVRLLRPGGSIGLVLPDILLLKNYPQTRKFLLDSLTFTRLQWHGRAFPGAVMDAVTVVGRKAPAPAGHRFPAVIATKGAASEVALPQSRFARPPAYLFNLHLDDESQSRLDHFDDCPRLGTYFEVHEGVHSGNIRAELFLDRPVDASCRELFFGRGELRPYTLRWGGRFIRLGVVPVRRTKRRYANAGRPHWFEQPKLLVRRTGDWVLAAVDDSARYASNNFFVVFPRLQGALDLHGLAAVLNSRLMTWYFRAVVPRRGRAFAELKIRNLDDYPLPRQVVGAGGCDELNRLGGERARANAPALDAHIEEAVRRAFAVPWPPQGHGELP
jgi:hypothetical protein